MSLTSTFESVPKMEPSIAIGNKDAGTGPESTCANNLAKIVLACRAGLIHGRSSSVAYSPIDSLAQIGVGVLTSKVLN